MKIFTAKQIYLADKSTIEKQGITSTDLMERAATQIFQWIHTRMQGAQVKIHVFCGIGNNGGDGMALARHLLDHGYDIEVFVVNYSKKRSADFLINLNRLKERKVWPVFLDATSELPEIGKDAILVDAIFGIGLNRKPDLWVKELMQFLNKSEAFILSVDVPSGLYLDKAVEDTEAVIKANYVLSFQVPKLVFFLPGTGIYSNQWEILDIGLDAAFLTETETSFRLIGKKEVLGFYVPREKFSHKGTYGHALIIGGSRGKIGAVVLASKAALRVGSGLVSTYIPTCGYLPVQASFAEGMVLTDLGAEIIEDISFPLENVTIGLGVGMGTEGKTIKALSKFLSGTKSPLVVDADGLNMLAKKKSVLKHLPKQSILTPHPKELERLMGTWKDDFEKLDKARSFSNKYGCVLVIKGAHTIILYRDKGYVNTTGNPGMATAGSGDVLTGMITGFLAQGYEPLQASIFGVYLHGRAGDIAVEKMGYQALTASDLIATIGDAFLDLFKVPDGANGQQTSNGKAS